MLDQVRALVAAGELDVTLTGVDIGHYGWDLDPRTTLAALLRELAEVDGLRWLRLSSVLPSYFTPELLDAVTTLPAIAPHLHLPLQSGSDRVLRLMRRPYHTAMYRALVERLTAAIPDLGLGRRRHRGTPGRDGRGLRGHDALRRRRCRSRRSTSSPTRTARGPRPRAGPITCPRR